jgi:hypothetical protein
MKTFVPWVTLACACSVMAQPENNESAIKVEKYHYGMLLDIASVIFTTEPADKCNASPVTMIYRDSEGHLKGLEYIVLAPDCAATNG